MISGSIRLLIDLVVFRSKSHALFHQAPASAKFQPGDLLRVVVFTSAVLHTQTSEVWRKTRSRKPIREQKRHQVIPGDMLTRCLCITMATEGVLQ